MVRPVQLLQQCPVAAVAAAATVSSMYLTPRLPLNRISVMDQHRRLRGRRAAPRAGAVAGTAGDHHHPGGNQQQQQQQQTEVERQRHQTQLQRTMPVMETRKRREMMSS